MHQGPNSKIAPSSEIIEAQNGFHRPETGIVRRPPLYQNADIASPAPYPAELNDESPGAGIMAYWYILSRRKGTWLAIAGIFGLLGLLGTFFQAPVYQASTSLEVLGLNENFMNMKEASPLTNSDGNYDTSEVQTQIEMLKSASLLKRVASTVRQSYAAQPPRAKLAAVVTKLLGRHVPTPAEALSSELGSMISTMKIKAPPQTRIITLNVDSTDPKLAALFANTLIGSFVSQSLDARLTTTEKTSQWLGRQLEDMRAKLEASETALQAYAHDSGLFFLPRDSKDNISLDKLRQMQQGLSLAEQDRMSKQSHYEAAKKGDLDALPEVLNDPGMRDMRSKLAEMEKQKSDLTALFTPSYPKVRRIQAQILSIQKVYEQNRSEIIGRIQDDYLSALRTEELLKTAYIDQTKVVSGEGEKSIKYSILQRDVEINTQLYETMLSQLKQSTIASAMRASNLRVIDAAEIPPTPYKPNRTLYSGVGLLIGMFLGAVFIIIREQADRTIQQPGETVSYLNTLELGIIPSFHALNPGKRTTLATATGAKNLVSGTGASAGLTAWQSRHSAFAESFRSTLISILFAGETTLRPKVMVVSSAGAGEGKSTVISNLAIATAEIGIRVLLIDADMRRPSLHKVFGMNNEEGLSTLLADKPSMVEGTEGGRFIRDTGIPGLSLLTSGPVSFSSSATNLLYGPYMPDLLKALRDEFDVILIDTPPMLRIPDARVLARIADGVVLVIRAGITTRDEALAAHQRFHEDGSNLLGTILNDWNPERATSRYNYGYKYTFNYKSDPYTTESE